MTAKSNHWAAQQERGNRLLLGLTTLMVRHLPAFLMNPCIWFVVFLMVLQLIEGNLIYPRVVGSSVGLPAMWVLAAVTVGGGLFGIIGMLFGVPTASIVYALLRRNVNHRILQKEAAFHAPAANPVSSKTE